MEFHSDNRMLHRIIRIERDYSLGDGVTRFSTEYPKELDGRVSARTRHWPKNLSVFIYNAVP